MSGARPTYVHIQHNSCTLRMYGYGYVLSMGLGVPIGELHCTEGMYCTKLLGHVYSEND